MHSDYSKISYLAFNFFVVKEPGKVYRHIIRYMSWPKIERFKKHKALAHCKDVPNSIGSFRQAWKGVSGIYKITFLPFRLFRYYGSSVDLGSRFKYHYYNGPKQNNFLGIFLKVFGWSFFSITVVETCSRDQLNVRENWYLSTFKPLLNILKVASSGPRVPGILSSLTRSKISASLQDRTDSEITRARKSKSKQGENNPFYGKGPGIRALDIAAEKAGTKVYVYDATNFTLMNGGPFRSIRMAAESTHISTRSLARKLDTGKPFKGYYYYSHAQSRGQKP